MRKRTHLSNALREIFTTGARSTGAPSTRGGAWRAGITALALLFVVAACGPLGSADDPDEDADDVSVEEAEEALAQAEEELKAAEEMLEEATARDDEAETAPEQAAPADRTAQRTETREATRPPAETAPREEATEPAPEPEPEPEPEVRTVTVPSGTALKARLNQELSTKDNQVGDTFTATLTESVLVGRTIAVPEGARLMGELTAVQRPGDDSDPVLVLNIERVVIDGDSHRLAVEITEAEPRSGHTARGIAARIGGGAAAGAVLGRVIGGGTKEALLGGAAGAAAGSAVHLATKDSDLYLREDSSLGLELTEPLVLPIE